MDAEFNEKMEIIKRPDDLSAEISADRIFNGVKLTNAVYNILDFFPEGEPLKNKAKEKALAILENLTLIFEGKGWVSLKIYFSAERERAIMQLPEDIEILENYLKLGKLQGWIDSVNFLIIVNEYDKIKSEIIKMRAVIKNSPARNKKHIEDVSNMQTEKALIEFKEKPKEHPYKQNKATARQEKILDMLSEKGKAQVADLIKQLPNITKRTIRRDLGDLLKSGKITRSGEWNQVFYTITS